MKHRALFSVMPHKELVYFAKNLISKNWTIISTSKATSFLKDNGIKTTDISEFIGVKDFFKFPPTLHPKIEHALTADNEDSIDLVYDIPYSLDVGNDVGGHTLLALAAKGKKIPVMEINDMRNVVDSIAKEGKIKKELMGFLIEKANFLITSHYLKLASSHCSYFGILGKKHSDLLNGENPYQMPAQLFDSLTDDSLAISSFKQVSGELPCLTNLADLDSILETMCKLHGALKVNGFDELNIAIASKHGNPCGVGISQNNPTEAINKALWGNAKGIWGGEIITNFPVDENLAKQLKESQERKTKFGSESWMLDVIAVPDISHEAIKILGTSSRRKIFVNFFLSSTFLKKAKEAIRPVRGGFLKQPSADYLINLKELEWTSKPKLNKIDLIISWAVAFTSFHGGNEVAIAKDSKLLGIGGGPSTFDAANTAISRLREANHDSKGSVFGADAFFPFTDVPEILFKAGCIAGTVPRGGRREKEVIDFFKEKKTSVGFIPEKYRGFCRH